MNATYKEFDRETKHLDFIIPKISLKFHSLSPGARVATLTLAAEQIYRFEFMETTLAGKVVWVERREQPAPRPGDYYTDLNQAVEEKIEDFQCDALFRAQATGRSDLFERGPGGRWRYDVHGTGPGAPDGIYIRVHNKAPLGGYVPDFTAIYVNQAGEEELIAQAQTSFHELVTHCQDFIKALEKEAAVARER